METFEMDIDIKRNLSYNYGNNILKSKNKASTY